MPIASYRASFLWAAAERGLANPNAIFADLATRAGFETRVEALSGNGGGVLELPWSRSRPPHLYWDRFFDGKRPENIKGTNAYKNLAPLRVAGPLARFEPPAAVHGVQAGTVNGFIFPHAVGIVFDVKGRGDFELATLVAELHQIRKGGRFAIAGDKGSSLDLNLSELATKLLNHLRAMVGLPSLDRKPDEAFTVVTILKGDGVDPMALPSASVLRFCNALAAWPAKWKYAKVPTGYKVPTRADDSALGDLLFASRRGRVIWFPRRFLAEDPPAERHPSALGCYHKNLVLGSLQVESLLAFTRAIVGVGAADLALLDDMAHRAAGLIGRLNGGTTDTYRSRSLARQIADSGSGEAIANFRHRYGMGPLHPPLSTGA